MAQPGEEVVLDLEIQAADEPCDNSAPPGEVRGRNATGVSGAKLAAVRGKAKSPLGFPFVRLRGLTLAMMSSSGRQSWNVLTQIPGEPGACRMCGRIRCVTGEMSRWAAHAALSDTPGCSNS